MARYGGGTEDFNEEAAKLRAMREQRERMIASERTYQDELAKSTGLEAESQRAETTRRRAKVESRDVSRREAEAGRQATRAVNVDTAAIERNTAARRRNAAEAQRQQVNTSRAFAGARDPMFAPAYGIRGAETTQYAMRQQLEGVGSRRARAMQEAMQLGIRPSAGHAAPIGPQTRAEGALSAKAAADLEAAQATKAYANSMRRKTATPEDVESRLREREAARTKQRAANVELESARSAEAASRANTQAMQTETRGREQVARAKVEEAKFKPYGLLPAAGQTHVAPYESRAQVQTIRTVGPRADIREAGFGGAVGTPQGDRAFAQGQAREAVRTGNLSEAHRIYTNVLGDEERAKAAARSQSLSDFFDKEARAANTLGRATRDAGINFYPLSQAMHRHGALTTEFIAAAARGETTLGELGNQALLTAGKFAGWTLAATAVYGVAGALHQVASGAAAAQSGTEQAFRVITQNRDADSLKGSFADLASEFNVPIDVAADSVYRMGQVFHDQTDAIEAARSALYSYKTGEVDVATSTRNLIAIVNGFGLSADSLAGIYDQINEAQNEFGISIGDTEAGLAKAAGVYRNAGGDLDYLLGLFVAIQKATGRSGTEIGTGIARAVQRIREPISIEKLQAQGIEVDPQDFQKTLKNALRVARTSPVDFQEVATGLFGNQYARLIAPVLADQSRLNEALEKTSPEKAKGSAQNELARVLKQVDEQIQMVATNLQVLGTELARAGAFNFIFLALRGFNELLHITTQLVDTFNALPAPLRTAVSMLAQMAAAVALLRKFGATERLAGTPFSFLAAPGARERTRTLAGVREAEQQARNRVERIAASNIDSALQVDTAQRAALKFDRSGALRGVQGLALDDPRRVAVESEAIAVQSRLNRARSALEAATEQGVAAQEILDRSTADLAAVQASSARNIASVRAQRAIALPGELRQPNSAGIIGVGGAPLGGGAPPRAFTDADFGRSSGVATAVRESRKRRTQAQVVARQTTAVMDNLRFSLQSMTGGARLGRAYDQFERAGNVAVRGAQRAGSAAVGAARSMRTMPGAMRGLVSSLGVFDVAILGFLAIEGLSAIGDKLTADLDKVDEEFSKYKGNTLKAQQKMRETEVPSMDPLLEDTADFFHRLKFWETVPQAIQGQYESPEDKRLRLEQEKADEIQLQERRKAIQDANEAAGKPRPQLTADEFISSVREQQRRLRAGLITRKQYEAFLERAQVELFTLLDPTKKQRAAGRVALAEASVQGGDPRFRESIADLSGSELDTQAQAIQAVGESTGRTSQALHRLAIVYAERVNDLADKTDAKSLIELAEARKSYFQAVEQLVQSELDRSLDLAGGDEGARRAAFNRARDQYGQIAGPRSEAARRYRRARRDYSGAVDDRESLRRRINNLDPADDATGENPLTGEGELGRLPNRRERLMKRLEETNKDVEKYRQQRKKFKEEFEDAKKKQGDLERALDRASYEDRQTGRNIRLQLRLSQTASGSEQSALQIQFAQRQVKDAADTFGKNSREYRQALTQLNNARMDAVQQMLRDVDAENSLMIARAGNDPGAQARARVQAEVNRLNTLQSQGGKVDPNEVKEQQARLIEAQNAQQEQARQEAAQIASLQAQIAQARAGGDPVRAARIAVRAARRARASAKGRVERLQALLDLINANNQLEEALREQEQARTDLLESRTEDPVKIAELEAKQARRNIKGTKGLDRVRAKAEYNRRKTDLRNAKIDSRQDDIEFMLEMEQITREEAAKQLEQLAKVKGISKQKKRELLLAAKRLRDEASGEYDIDIGSIKLPTLYEIRRFVQGGMPVGPAGGTAISNNQSINITVNSEGDMQRVIQVLEDNLSGSNKSIARNVGVR